MLRGVGAALAGGAALGNPHAASALIGGAYVSQAEMAARGLVGLTVGDPSMLKQRSGMCTGTLIGDGLILTARHCATNPAGLPLEHAVFSNDLFAADAVRRPVEKIIVGDHPECDLAIIRHGGATPAAHAPVTLVTSLNAAYSAADDDDELAKEVARLYGFGVQSDSFDGFGELRPGRLKALRASINGPIEGSSPLVTVEEPANGGECYGDSGGPLFLPTCPDAPSPLRDARGEPLPRGLAQIGVLSFGGAGTECRGGADEFVNLADYGEWIDDAVARLGGAPPSELRRA